MFTQTPLSIVQARFRDYNTLPLLGMAETTEDASDAPKAHSYSRLEKHHLLPSNKPDYLRLILTSKVYEILKETPLVLATNLSTKLGNEIWLKREDLQEVFSFKIRGAYNFMSSLSDEERWKGVITCSAGKYPSNQFYLLILLSIS